MLVSESKHSITNRKVRVHAPYSYHHAHEAQDSLVKTGNMHYTARNSNSESVAYETCSF